MTRDKPRYSAPGHVLVDDRLTARDGWERRGGIFIHHIDAEHTIAALAALGFRPPDRALAMPPAASSR
jgi:hypothetical protein